MSFFLVVGSWMLELSSFMWNDFNEILSQKKLLAVSKGRSVYRIWRINATIVVVDHSPPPSEWINLLSPSSGRDAFRSHLQSPSLPQFCCLEDILSGLNYLHSWCFRRPNVVINFSTSLSSFNEFLSFKSTCHCFHCIINYLTETEEKVNLSFHQLTNLPPGWLSNCCVCTTGKFTRNSRRWMSWWELLSKKVILLIHILKRKRGNCYLFWDFIFSKSEREGEFIPVK